MPPKDDAEKLKVRACRECHRTKNKCVFQPGASRCDRCIRLNRECVPHISRQGKRKANGQTPRADLATQDDSSSMGKSGKACNTRDFSMSSMSSMSNLHAGTPSIPVHLNNAHNMVKKNRLGLEQLAQLKTANAQMTIANFGGNSAMNINLEAGRINSSMGSSYSNFGNDASTLLLLAGAVDKQQQQLLQQQQQQQHELHFQHQQQSIGSAYSMRDASHFTNNNLNNKNLPISELSNSVGDAQLAAEARRDTNQRKSSADQVGISQTTKSAAELDQVSLTPGQAQSPTLVNNLDQVDSDVGSSSCAERPEEVIAKNISRACNKLSGKRLSCLCNHYGIQCQIREWISMALVRRSFALLGRASSLATRCGISMDRILCGVVGGSGDDSSDDQNRKVPCDEEKPCVGRRMSYLLAALLEPKEALSVPISERFMMIPHLSTEFLALIGCQNCPTFHPSDIRNRWILIRETKEGVSRFYCSPEFERNVLSWTHISQVYEDNLVGIFNLLFSPQDFRTVLACLAHQMSCHSVEGPPKSPVHAPRVKLRRIARLWGPFAKYSDPNRVVITKEMIKHVKGPGNVSVSEMNMRFLFHPTSKFLVMRVSLSCACSNFSSALTRTIKILPVDKTTYYFEFFHPYSCGSGDSMSSSRNGGAGNWTRTTSDVSLADRNTATANSPEMKTVLSNTPKENDPPNFDDVMHCEHWIGIDDILASGNMDELVSALID